MATLLVSDTSVLLDLERGGMLATLFQLPFEVGVPDVMLREGDQGVGRPRSRRHTAGQFRHVHHEGGIFAAPGDGELVLV